MSSGRWLLELALTVPLAVSIVGCDRSPQTAETRPSTPATDPTTAPLAYIPPVTQPAAEVAPQPVNTFITISDNERPPQTVEFPPAKLRLRKIETGLQAVLYTDDPREATSKDYRGNSYLFEMDLDVSDPADINKVQGRFRAEGSEADRNETTNGVFLNGWETHLQPADAIVVFEGQSPNLIAKVVGRFTIADQDRNAASKSVLVQALIPVMLEKDRKK